LNYQISYAVLRALRLFPEVLNFSVRNPFIKIEPRFVQNQEVTRWDLSFSDPWEVAEAKLTPSKEDLSEWLERAKKLGSESEAKLVLVFSKSTTRRVSSLKGLIRIAQEARDEEEKFRRLVELEAVRNHADLLMELGDHPLRLLQRMKLLDFPEHILEDQISFYSTVLAGEKGGPVLREFLFAEVANAVSNRGTLHIQELIRAARNRGITLNTPPSVNVLGLPEEIRATLLLLRECLLPVPGEILGAAVGLSEEDLRARLESAHISASVVSSAAGWKLAPLPLPLPHAGSEICAKALRFFLAFVDRHKNDVVGGQQARNAIALARACAVTHPEAVSRMFISLDKPLKSLGDKHLVLEAAELTVTSARRNHPRSQADVKGEAQALICGTSWALQRIDRLPEALNFAEQSLSLGNAIGWERNTAFCEKCIGRLYRTMAEEAKKVDEKAKLLQMSADYLQKAIARFSASAEFGPQSVEVGDCYSLLGRTHLVANARGEARRAVRRASTLVPPTGGKDYMDLRILEGELLEATDQGAADVCYSEVVDIKGDADSEKSDIVARAYFRRGLNRAEMKSIDAAVADLLRAEALWEQLGEYSNAARAAWKRFRLQGVVPKSALRSLTAESVLVRVAAMKEHQNRVAAFTGTRVARRSEPGPEYWLQMIKDARARVAVNSVTW
jgi:tetratricopeptide (TPR) repeat protein